MFTDLLCTLSPFLLFAMFEDMMKEMIEKVH